MRSLTAILVAMATIVACSSTNLATRTSSSPTSALPGFDRIVLIVLENTSYPAVTADPGFQALAAKGTLLSSYYGVAHNSLPNYIALTSGASPTAATRQNCPDFNCQVGGPNLADQLEAAGRSWKEYVGGTTTPCLTPSPGSHDNFVSGYVMHHNAFAYYPSAGASPAGGTPFCQAHVRPLDEVGQDAGSGLPAFALLVPDSCDDGHDQPCKDGRVGGLATAVPWLAREVGTIVGSPSWTSRSLLVITFDEGAGGDNASCCGTSNGGHVATVLIGGRAKVGFVDGEVGDHYSVLRTIEEGLGLRGYLGRAAQRAPLVAAFDVR